MGISCTEKEAGMRQEAAEASEGGRGSGAGADGTWIIALLLMVLTIMAGPFIHRPCLASEDMTSLTAAMAEHLKCYPLELLSHERQQLAVTSKDLCLAAVYHHTGLSPFWVTPEGPSPKASVVLDFLINAEAEGLDPKNYEVDQIAALFAERRPESLARLDTLLTFNLIKYIHDVSKGQIKLRDDQPVRPRRGGKCRF